MYACLQTGCGSLSSPTREPWKTKGAHAEMQELGAHEPRMSTLPNTGGGPCSVVDVAPARVHLLCRILPSVCSSTPPTPASAFAWWYSSLCEGARASLGSSCSRCGGALIEKPQPERAKMADSLFEDTEFKKESRGQGQCCLRATAWCAGETRLLKSQ